MLIGAILGLIKGKYVQLGWYQLLSLLLFFINPTLKFYLGYFKLILINATHCATHVEKVTLVSGSECSDQELDSLEAAYLKVFPTQFTQFGKPASLFSCHLVISETTSTV